MKLPDFLENKDLNHLRKKMGAPFIPWNTRREWHDFNPEVWRKLQRLEREGIDVELKNLNSTRDGTFEYYGEKVVIYLGNQQTNSMHTGTPGDGYRYHIIDCYTLEKRRERCKRERYVITNRKDGKFVVNRSHGNQPLERGLERDIPVCKNCLKRLNYKNYNSSSELEKEFIWQEFNLIDFFYEYSGNGKKGTH